MSLPHGAAMAAAISAFHVLNRKRKLARRHPATIADLVALAKRTSVPVRKLPPGYAEGSYRCVPNCAAEPPRRCKPEPRKAPRASAKLMLVIRERHGAGKACTVPALAGWLQIGEPHCRALLQELRAEGLIRFAATPGAATRIEPVERERGG